MLFQFSIQLLLIRMVDYPYGGRRGVSTMCYIRLTAVWLCGLVCTTCFHMNRLLLYTELPAVKTLWLSIFNGKGRLTTSLRTSVVERNPNHELYRVVTMQDPRNVSDGRKSSFWPHSVFRPATWVTTNSRHWFTIFFLHLWRKVPESHAVRGVG